MAAQIQIIGVPPGKHRGTLPIAIDGKKTTYHQLGDIVELPISVARALSRDGLAKIISEHGSEAEKPAETHTTVVVLAEPWDGEGHRKAQEKTAENFRLLYTTCLGIPVTSRGWADAHKGMTSSLVDCLEPLVNYHCARVPVDIEPVENVLCRIARSINPGPLGPFPTFPFVPSEVFEIARPTLARSVQATLDKANVTTAKQEAVL